MIQAEPSIYLEHLAYNESSEAVPKNLRRGEAHGVIGPP